MEPSLLNDIYIKLSQNENGTDLQKATEKYLKQIYVTYLQMLDAANISDLSQKVKVQTKFPDGYVLDRVMEAVYHLINLILDSDDFKKITKRFDDEFLENCDCPNKDQILILLKQIIIDIGCDSIEKSDWMEIANGFQTCEDIDFTELE